MHKPPHLFPDLQMYSEVEDLWRAHSQEDARWQREEAEECSVQLQDVMFAIQSQILQLGPLQDAQSSLLPWSEGAEGSLQD